MRKKIVFLLLIITLFSVTPVYAINIHSCSESLNGAIIDAKIPGVVSTVVTIIKIAVPVVLVIMGMLDLFKGMTGQKEEEIKKGQQMFIKRLIAAALVFFVFIIVQFIIGIIADDKDKTSMMTCAKCFINGDCTYEKNANGTCEEGYVLSETGTYCIKK